MTLRTINLSTGPVGISKEVQQALQEYPLSHRSKDFKNIFLSTTSSLKEAFKVKQVYLLSGSGTLANEAMLQEISAIGKKGLILSNGEFGNRLILQAKRTGLHYTTYTTEWGTAFCTDTINAILQDEKPAWLLFCHCETSTGMINDLDGISALAKKTGTEVFADCMSTAGTTSIDLSQVSMATASSGKGLASIPGIAIVFSNRQLMPKATAPVYLDLYHYQVKEGLPFTLSSNLLKALMISIQQKINATEFTRMEICRKRIFTILNDHKLVPFNQSCSAVFTIVNDEWGVLQKLIQNNLVLSYESDYLIQRKWWQLATFGLYDPKEMDYVISVLNETLVLNTQQEV